jgi:hypothetical protein
VSRRMSSVSLCVALLLYVCACVCAQEEEENLSARMMECVLFSGRYDSCVMHPFHSESACPLTTRATTNKKNENVHVVSIGHHGFGNQLFQHTFAHMLARSLGIPAERVHLTEQTVVKEGGGRKNSIDGNTHTAFRALSKVVETVDHVPSFCSTSPWVFPMLSSMENYTQIQSQNNTVQGVVCIKLWGFFQHTSPDAPPFLCPSMVDTLWREPFHRRFIPALIAADTGTGIGTGIGTGTGTGTGTSAMMMRRRRSSINERDAAVYLRCSFNAYTFEDTDYYARILNRTATRMRYDRLFLLEAPDCHHVEHKHNFHYRYEQVHTMLTRDYHAIDYRAAASASSYSGSGSGSGSTADKDEHEDKRQNGDTHREDALLADFSVLLRVGTLIAPSSTWAEWAVILTNATEVHVPSQVLFSPDANNAAQDQDQDHARGRGRGRGQRIFYHDCERKAFFGEYNAHTMKIEYPPL